MLEGQLQQHRFVLEEIEAVAGDFGGSLKIHQVEPLADLHVVLGLESELRQGGLATRHLDRLHAQRRCRMGKVGNRAKQAVQLGGHLVHFRLGDRHLFAELASLFFACLAFGSVLGLADRLRDFVRTTVQLVNLLLAALAPAFQLHDPVDIGVDATVLAVLADAIHVLNNESTVEHGSGKK